MLTHHTNQFDDPPENTTQHRLCLHCEYDLHGLTTRTCPECGKPFDPNAPLIDVIFKRKLDRRATWFLFATPGATALTSTILLASQRYSIQLISNILLVAALTFITTSILVAAWNTQLIYIGNVRPSAFKRMPWRAFKSTTLMALAFFIAQIIIAFLFLIIFSLIGDTLTRSSP